MGRHLKKGGEGKVIYAKLVNQMNIFYLLQQNLFLKVNTFSNKVEFLFKPTRVPN